LHQTFLEISEPFLFSDEEFKNFTFSLVPAYKGVKTETAPLFYYHLPKCGGQTARLFEFALAISLGKKPVRVPSQWGQRWVWDPIPQELLHSRGFAYEGECYFGMHNVFGENFNLVTTVRHPVKRVVSEYFFMCKHYDRKASKDDFLFYINNGYDNNVMARWLTGNRLSLWIDKGEAVENLKQFSFVFDLPELNNGWSYIASAYGAASLLSVNANVVSHPEKFEYEEEFKTKILESNQIDLLVYEQGLKMSANVLEKGWNKDLEINQKVFGASFRHPKFCLGPLKETANQIADGKSRIRVQAENT